MFVKVVPENADDPDSDYIIMIGSTLVDLPASSFAVANGFAEQIESKIEEAINQIKQSIPEPSAHGM
jgi:hypothetical protein